MSQHPDPFVQHVHRFILEHLTSDNLMQDKTGTLHDAARLYRQSVRQPFDIRASHVHQQPALSLAACEGLHDIGTSYQLPYGLCAGVLESYAQVIFWTEEQRLITTHHANNHLHDLLIRLERDNPQLTQLRYDRRHTGSCYHVILGITSSFNTGDIQHYLDSRGFVAAIKDPTYATKFNAASQLVNRNTLGWVPAPATLDRIIAQKTAQLR